MSASQLREQVPCSGCSGEAWTTLGRMRQVLEGTKFDALIAVSPENLVYTSGCHLVLSELFHFNEKRDKLAVSLVPKGEEAVFIVWAQEEELARETSWIEDVRSFTFAESTLTVLADTVREKGLARGVLGVEKGYLPALYLQQLTEMLPEAQLESCEFVFTEARMVKTPGEIEVMREVAWLTARAVQIAYESAQSGDTESDVAADIVANVIRSGAEPMVFNFGSGRFSALGHRWASRDKRIAEGEVIHSDAKGRLRGYWSDVSRMAVVGNPTPETVENYAKLANIQHRLIEGMRPGVEARQIYNLSRELYHQEGINVEPRLIGHGIGTAVHEEPILDASCEEKLQPGMVLTVEPTHYAPDQRLHYEDMVLITEDEPEILSNYTDTSEIYVIR